MLPSRPTSLDGGAAPSCKSAQTNSGSADLMRRVSRPDNECICVQHHADPRADQCVPWQQFDTLSAPSIQPSYFHTQTTLVTTLTPRSTCFN